MNLNERDKQNNVSGTEEEVSATTINAVGAETENTTAKTKGNKPVKSKGPKKPMDKKSLIRIICISAAAAVAAVALTLGLVFGLKGSDKKVAVTFEAREHVAFVTDYLPDAKLGEGGVVELKNGTTVTFSIEVEEGYTTNPRVTANGNILKADNFVYSFVVDGETTVSVAEVFEISTSLSGSGTSQSPYLITSARDLNYMASMVNSGSSRYVLAYYNLANDIDCGGKGLDIIGNASGGSSFFGGYFDGKGHTISNYVINARGVEYAGLFGYVQASGNGDELGTITNLNLKDFTMNVFPSDGKNASVGSFIGYGYAANLLVSSAVNGTINIFGNNYFCYAGGAMGIQQSATASSNGSLYPFYSAVNYVHTDVDIFLGTGYIYAAGGISGYVFSDNEMATASVANSYSTGDIFGAIRVGGIAGMLGDYSSIANCYSTGEFEANSKLYGDNESMALAGGIVGHSGVNAIISDSFSTAKISASAVLGSEYAKTGDIVALSVEPDINQKSAMVYNCYSGNNANATNASFVKNTLHWTEVDWVIQDGSLPTINYGTVDSHSIVINFDYSGKVVNGKTTEQNNIQITQNYYTPLCDYFRYAEGGLSEVLISEDDYTSYGYYFDEELTKRVPYGYILTGNVTFYIGFADYSAVEGTYYFDNNGRNVEIKLNKDSSYVYSDGVSYQSAYTYDGEKLFFYDAPFARLAALKDGDSEPNRYYNNYNFVGEKGSDGKSFKLYDGVYFTAEEPLVISKDSSSTRPDAFFGYWEKSATLNKKYYFDGEGNWIYYINGIESDRGTYEVGADGAATLSGSGVKVSVHASGLLLFKDGNKEEYYCYSNSLFGTWFDTNTGNYLKFEGYGVNFSGEVLIGIDGNVSVLRYVKDGFFGENCYTLINGDMSLFGYIELTKNNTLNAILFSSAQGGFTEGHVFYLVDNYGGEWIGENVIDGVDFKDIDFNGFGIYEVESADGVIEKLGILTIDGNRVEYKVDVENGLSGEFEYNGKKYTLSYNDEDGTVIIKLADGSGLATLERKDALYEYTLVDDEGTVYTFNGGGNLSGGGKLAVSSGDVSEELGYKIKSGTIADKNLEVALLNSYNGNEIGSITIVNNLFRFTRGSSSRELEIRNSFTGRWAVSGFMYNITIGNFNLANTASGKFMDMESTATYTYYPDGNYIKLSYISGEMTQPVAMYLIFVEDGNIAVSSYPYLVSGDYYYAALQDEYFGTWYHSESRTHTMQFDGLADSKYSQGIAFDAAKNITYFYTRRFGKMYMWEYDNEAKMYVLEAVAYNKKGENIFNNGTRTAFEMKPFNAVSQPIISVTDGEVEYDIYLDGTIEIDGKRGTYQLVNVNGNFTELVIYQPGEDDVYGVVNHVEKTIIFD